MVLFINFNKKSLNLLTIVYVITIIVDGCVVLYPPFSTAYIYDTYACDYLRLYNDRARTQNSDYLHLVRIRARPNFIAEKVKVF